MDLEELSKSIAEKNIKAKRKATLFTVIPLVVGLLWLIFCAYQVSVYNGEVAADKKIADSLKEQSTKLSQTISANQKNLDSLQKMNTSVQNQVLAMQAQLISLQNEIPSVQGAGDSSSFRKVQFSLFNLISKYNGIHYDSLSSSIVQQKQPVVYIQIASESGRPKANNLVSQIVTMKYKVPSIEVMGRSNFVDEVKYYHPEDAASANAIAKKCDSLYSSQFLVRNYGSSKYKAPNGQIEVWIK